MGGQAEPYARLWPCVAAAAVSAAQQCLQQQWGQGGWTSQRSTLVPQIRNELPPNVAPCAAGTADEVIEESVADNDMIMIRGPRNTRAVTGAFAHSWAVLPLGCDGRVSGGCGCMWALAALRLFV